MPVVKYDKKAAIEIDASLGKFDVEIKNTTATGFDTKTEDGGIVLSEGLVNLKKAAKAEGYDVSVWDEWSKK